jgi:phospholipid/cholesterol/gamma-HCH transport system permease protein
MKQKNDYLEIADHEGQSQLRLHGDWVIENSEAILAGLKETRLQGINGIDASEAPRMDLWGSLRLKDIIDTTGAPVFLNDRQKRLFDFLPMEKSAVAKPKSDHPIIELFETFGKITTEAGKTTYGIIALIGEIGIRFGYNLIHPRSFRFHSIIRHIEETGLRALPIIGLLAVLISMVIAYQAATQLQKFGANIFTIDLTVISLLREMGVLVTAIMIAGRSGSAFAAEIGVMKLREEIDALKTMGFNPVEILVLPRLIAMMITLPILTFFADLMGLAGGGLISVLLLDIPLDQYIDRVEMVAKPTMFFVGLIKAPVFAFVITIIGTYQGMNVSGSAESVGKLTTVAVVQSIFLIIMLDALFSILFSTLGI